MAQAAQRLGDDFSGRPCSLVNHRIPRLVPNTGFGLRPCRAMTNAVGYVIKDRSRPLAPSDLHCQNLGRSGFPRREDGASESKGPPPQGHHTVTKGLSGPASCGARAEHHP